MVILFATSLFVISMTYSNEKDNTVKKKKVFTDLSSNEKKEAIAYILSTGNCEWE